MRREELAYSTLIQYAGKAERNLEKLLRIPATHPAGKTLQKQFKGWRTKFAVFITDRRVPLPNKISKREIRPSVVFRKVTNGFRSNCTECMLLCKHPVATAERLFHYFAVEHDEFAEVFDAFV